MRFDGTRNAHLEQVAAELYSDQMPYHSFNHVLGTLAVGAVLVERCLEEGVPVNGEVVYFTLLFHDAGYHKNHIGKGFTSKEEYSAHLAVQCLRAEAIPEATIRRVVAAILSTQRDAQFTTNEEKAVRAADLAGLASDYKTFRSDVEKLRQSEMLTGRKVAWDEWKTSVKETLSFYLSQEIRLAQFDALFCTSPPEPVTIAKRGLGRVFFQSSAASIMVSYHSGRPTPGTPMRRRPSGCMWSGATAMASRRNGCPAGQIMR
jgi:predicted metal-dependent HD superfamily phosphohydrolase